MSDRFAEQQAHLATIANMDRARTREQLRDKLAAANAEIERLKGEGSLLRQAVGYVTTIKGDLEMRPDDPIGMVAEVVAHVTRLRAALRETREALKEYTAGVTENEDICLDCGASAIFPREIKHIEGCPVIVLAKHAPLAGEAEHA